VSSDKQDLPLSEYSFRLTDVDVRLYVHQDLIFSDNSVPEEDQGPKSNMKLPEYFSVFRQARFTIV
jgi:hypothetical protein